MIGEGIQRDVNFVVDQQVVVQTFTESLEAQALRTDAVLREMGLSEENIATLRGKGVIA